MKLKVLSSTLLCLLAFLGLEGMEKSKKRRAPESYQEAKKSKDFIELAPPSVGSIEDMQFSSDCSHLVLKYSTKTITYNLENDSTNYVEEAKTAVDRTLHIPSSGRHYLNEYEYIIINFNTQSLFNPNNIVNLIVKYSEKQSSPLAMRETEYIPEEDVGIIVISPDNKNLCLGLNSGEIRRIDLATGNVYPIGAHSDWIRDLIFLNEDILISQGDNKIKIWNAKNLNKIKSLKVPQEYGNLDNIELTKSGKYLIAFYSNGKIVVWETENFRPKKIIAITHRNEEAQEDEPTKITSSHNDQYIILNFGRRVEIWDLENSTCIKSINPESHVFDIELSSDNRYLLFRCIDSLIIYDLKQ